MDLDAFRRGQGPFRGRQAPHDDVRSGRLNVSIEVRRSRLQPIDRGRHNRRPGGDIAGAASRAGDSSSLLGSNSDLGLTPFENCSIDPDAMKDDGDFPRNRNLRLFHANPLD